MKRNERFIRTINFLNGEVGFAKFLNVRGANDLHIPWCAPVPVHYLVILRFLVGVPTKSVENILEGMNHGFFI